MSEQVEGQLTLFPADSPASHSPLPGGKEAREMTVTSGRKWLELSKNSGPLGLLEKMLLESLEWHSLIFYLSWKPVDIGQGHFLFQLALSEPDIEDTESQLWATPTAQDYKRRGPNSNQQGLPEQVRMYNTPTAQDAKKQYTAAESNEEGFTGWRCDEGNICDTTSGRLSNGSSESVGGQGTQEQESKRPDSNVSDSDNRSRDVRRDGEFPTIKETERAGSNIGGRAQKHETGERRTAESVLGGVVDGLPAWMDRDLDFLINHYWDDEPDIPRIAAGIEHRVDRLKCLGNAVVPQQFYPIFKAIAEIAEQTKGERRCRSISECR